MGAVWYRARADLRGRVGGTLLLILLVGVTGGVVLAAVAGAQRSRDAIPEFLTFARSPDVAVQINPSLPAAEQDRLAHELLTMPELEVGGAVSQPILTVPAQGDLAASSGFVGSAIIEGPYLRDVDR